MLSYETVETVSDYPKSYCHDTVGNRQNRFYKHHFRDIDNTYIYIYIYIYMDAAENATMNDWRSS